MPGFPRSQTTTQSLMCSAKGCQERAKDMCVEHYAAFCAKHFQAHIDEAHDGKSPGSGRKKSG